MSASSSALAAPLHAAVAALAEVRPDTPEAVASCGAVLEELLATADCPAPLEAALGLVLEVLQRVYESTTDSAEAELQGARELLARLGDAAEQDEVDGRAWTGAAQALWLLLAKPAGASPFAEAQATMAGSRTVADLAAVCIGLEPEDDADLRQLAGELQALAAASAWPPAAAALVAAALNGLGSGTAAGLGEAAGALAELAETVAPADTPDDAPASPPPPAEPEPAPIPPEPEAPAEPGLLCLERNTDPDLIAEFVSESLTHLQTCEVALLDLELNPEDREALNAVFRGFHTIKGTAGFLGLPQVQRLAHHAEALLDRARNGELRFGSAAADLSLQAADLLKTMVTDLAGAGPEDELSVPPELAELLEHLAAFTERGPSAPEAETPAPSLPGAPAGPARDIPDLAALAQPAGPQKQSREGTDSTLRVRTDRLDALINMVGELVIANAMLLQDEVVQGQKALALGRKAEQLNKITRELQDLGMSMRMVPLRNTFQKMARVVRDIAHKSGKEVHFQTEGEDTEIDRGMVEALADPLLHMVRNAVDHGLEAPDERTAAGKPAAGTVTLRAFQAAGVVVIELQDDGRGLDRERILAKAVAQGLVDEGRDLPDSEVYRLIFAAGLSTAEKVTDISGRGVGMDVVARNLEALRGRVEITSARGEGTTFSIRLPLTLAIMEGMLARVGQERYIIPTISIQQAFQAQADEITTLGPGSEIVRFRDRLVPIVRLHRVFGVADAVEDCAQALLVIAEQGTSRFALMVDELLGQQQIVIKSLGRGLQQVPGLSGSAILGDGRVGLILDLAGLDVQVAESTAA